MIRQFKSKLSSDKNLKELLTGSVITFTLKILGLILGYILVYVISKKNGSAGVGYYSLIIQSLVLLGMVASMGTNVSVLRYIGQFNHDSKKGQLRILYRKILSLVFPISLIFGAVTYLLAGDIAQHVFKNEKFKEGIEIVGIILPFFTMNAIGIEYIRGLKKLHISEFIRTVSQPLIILVCIFIYWNQDITDVQIIYFLMTAIVINSVLSNGTIVNYLRKTKRSEKSVLTHKGLFKVSFPMMIGTLSTFLMSSLSLFVIEYFEPTEKVGIYSVAFRLSQMITLILVVVGTVVAPKFSELHWSEKKEELQHVLHISAKLTFWTSFSISVLMILLSNWVLGVFGEEYLEGQWTLIILIGGQLFSAASGLVSLMMNMSGNQSTLRNIALLSLGALVVLSIFLIPIYGILGAAIAFTFAMVTRNLLCIIYVHKKLRLRTYYIPFISNKRTMDKE